MPVAHALFSVLVDLIDYVVFKRDDEGNLRGKCKLCRPGKCCIYRAQQSEGSASMARATPAPCDCGHGNFHHELIEDSSTFHLPVLFCWVFGSQVDEFCCCCRAAGLYGKKTVDSTSAKGKRLSHRPTSCRSSINANSGVDVLFDSHAALRNDLQAPVRLDVVDIVVRHSVLPAERVLGLEHEREGVRGVTC